MRYHSTNTALQKILSASSKVMWTLNDSTFSAQILSVDQYVEIAPAKFTAVSQTQNGLLGLINIPQRRQRSGERSRSWLSLSSMMCTSMALSEHSIQNRMHP